MKNYLIAEEIELLKNYLSPIKNKKIISSKKNKKVNSENLQMNIDINKVYNNFKEELFLITENFGKYDGEKKFEFLNNFSLKIKEVFSLYKKDLKKIVFNNNEKIKIKFDFLLKNFLEKKSEIFLENIFINFENYFDEVFKINYFDSEKVFMKKNLDRLNLDLSKKIKNLDNFNFFYNLKKIEKKIKKLFHIKNDENNNPENSQKITKKNSISKFQFTKNLVSELNLNPKKNKEKDFTLKKEKNFIIKKKKKI